MRTRRYTSHPGYPIGYRLSAIGYCILVLLILTACAAPIGQAVAPTATAAAPGGTRTRVGFGGLEFEAQRYKALIERFNAENPDIEVSFVPLDFSLLSGGPAEAARSLAAAADTLIMPPLDAAAFSAGAFADLQPLIAADPAFEQEDYLPGALDPTSAAVLTLLPTSIGLQIVNYNRDLWTAAGLPEPEPGWSWEDLLARAEALTSDTVAGIDDGRGGELIMLGLLHAAGIDLSPDSAAALDRPEVAAVLERVRELIERGVIYQRPEAQAGAVSIGDLGAHIRDGGVAIWLAGGLPIGGPGNQSPPPFEVGEAALPGMPRDLLGSVDGYAMSAGSPHPEAAWRWLSWLSRQAPSSLEGIGLFMIGQGVSVPARRSLAEASGFWAGLSPARAAALRQALETFSAAPPPVDTLATEALIGALRAVHGGQPAEQALAEALPGLEQQLAERAAATPEPPPAVELPQPTVRAANARPVRFGALGSPPELRRLAEAFNAQSTDTFVEVEPISFGGSTDLAEIAPRYDCLMWPEAPTPDDYAALRDLQPLLDSSTIPPGDYPAGLLAAYRDGRRLYGLPYAVQLRLLNYNRDRFDAAGLDYPQADWDYAELLSAAAALTDASGGDANYGYVVTQGHASDLLAFLSWQGVRPTRGSGESLSANLDDPALEAAVARYLELLRAASPDTTLSGYRAGDFSPTGIELTQSGRAGMWFSAGLRGMIMISIGAAGSSAREPNLAIAPPPTGAAGLSAAEVSGSSLLISAASANPEGCWEWLSFLSAQTGGLGDRFPARASVAESQEYLRQARPGAAEVYAAYKPALERPAAAADQSRLDPFWLLQAADRALQGADLARELETAQATSQAYLGCLSGGDSPAECAAAVDPEYAGLSQ